MDRLIQYPAQIPLVEDMLNAQRNAMVGIGHLAGAAFGANTVAASGFACAPGEGLALTLAPGALLAPGVVDASAYGTLAAVSSALVRQFISRDPVTLAVSAAGATYIVSVAPQTVDTDDTVLPFYNAADPSVTYAGEGNSGLAAPTVRRDEAALSIGASVPEGSYPLWQIVVPAGATAITADMIAVASGAPFYPSLAAVAPRIVAPFNGQLAEAIGGYPLNAVVADPTTPGTFWVSTADANVSVPGATGATWQSLFNGYATQAWANGQFLQLADTAVQTVTGPVTFSGITMVPTPTDYTEKQAIGASDADARYARVAYANTFTALLTFNAGADIGSLTNPDQVLTFYASNAYTMRAHPYVSGTEQGLAVGVYDGDNNAFGWLNIPSTGRPYTNIGILALTSELPHTTYSGNAGDAGSYTITAYTDPSTPSGKRYRISGQTAEYTSEGSQTISLPLTLNGILPGAWGATMFWPSKINNNNDQIAQITATPTVSTIQVNVDILGSVGTPTWPCYVTWWVEGY
ncbi:hypothetical protein [Acetobacter okinawensis]|uniref:hypothetical protein n=1 Tax=Acetobacter okinawensis TaxID=1076594 RepID=UPI001FD6216E|nr:hypothetical protein [Acetobacter okinawensis]